MTLITVLIPTLNEAQGIAGVLDGIPVDIFESMGHDTEILVIDGGSSDGTCKIASDKGAKVILERGCKASAVRRGLRESSGEYVFTIDGDGTYPPERMVDMLVELKDGSAMVLASRLNGELCPGSMSSLNGFGNRFLTKMANGLYGVKVTDLCTGLRGFKRSSLDGREPPGKGFEIEAGIHSLLADKGISEVPIEYRARK